MLRIGKSFHLEELKNNLAHIPDFAWNILLVLTALAIGYLCEFLLSLFLRKTIIPDEKKFSIWRVIIKRMSRPMKYFLPLLVLILLLPLIKVKSNYYNVINKAINILVMISFAGIMIAVVKIFEDYVYHAYDIQKADNLRERKIRTQLQFVRRLLTGLILITTTCFILLSFDSLRRLGAGLLTGVGVGGIIIGFAAQKSLGSFLAGFQIAFTQPMRIDDVLIVENEWGRVEEITLTYVVLKLWDQRNLIIPINYFIEKPFQNWTRVSAAIMGTVFLYLDYNVPLDPLRKELTRLLEASPLWDKRVNVLQVTNASEHTIEIRALMSASDSGKAFDLRCEVREGLVNFVRENYPDSLPVMRATLKTSDKTSD